MERKGLKWMTTALVIFLSVLILIPAIPGQATVRVSGIISYKDGSTTYPLQHAELRFHEVSDGAILTYAWTEDKITDGSGYYEVDLPAGDWVVEITYIGTAPGLPHEYKIFALINVDGLTAENITLGPWRKINVTAKDYNGDPFANQEVRVTVGESLPQQMNADDLWCTYWDRKVTDSVGSPVTLYVLPTTVTTMDGTYNIKIKSEWLYLYNPGGKNTENPTQITVVDGSNYTIQAGSGQWVQFACLRSDGVNLWDATSGDFMIGSRLLKEGFYITFGDMKNVGGPHPLVKLQSGSIHQIVVRASGGAELPGYFEKVIGRDLSVDESTTNKTLSLPSIVEIDAQTSEAKEFQDIGSYQVSGSSDIYWENINDYKSSVTPITACTLKMFESQRILIECWPVDPDFAETEFRKYLPIAASLEGNRFQINDITFYRKDRRILVASPSQIRQGETGTIVIGVVADEIQYLIDNNLLHTLNINFERDITINEKGYIKSITLAEEITAHIFYLKITVDPSAETGYVPLTVSRGTRSVTCKYVLEIINNEQEVQSVTPAGYSISSSRNVLVTPKSSISQPCIVSQGSFNVSFPQPTVSIPEPTVATTDKAIAGWRILEQADVTVGAYSQYPSNHEFRLKIHFVPDALYGLNRNDLVVFHQSPSGQLTELPVIFEGPPTALDVVVRTKLLGNISLAIRDSDYNYEKPLAAKYWDLYR